MDEFRTLCHDLLTSGKFTEPVESDRTQFEVFGLSMHGGACRIVRKLQSPQTLKSFLFDDPRAHWQLDRDNEEAPIGAEKVHAAVLRIVQVQMVNDDLLGMNADLLVSFLNTTGIDQAALWLILHKYDGFHYFPGDETSLCDTFSFGCADFCLIWSFAADKLATNGLLINRRDGSKALVNSLITIISRHRQQIFSPAFIGYCLSLAICTSYDQAFNAVEGPSMRKIARSTGYHLALREAVADLETDKLTKWLQETDSTLVSAFARKSTLRTVSMILDRLEASCAMNVYNGIQQSLRETMDDSTRCLVRSIPLMRSRIHAHNEYMDYVAMRVERLSVALSALISHKDAYTSLELARASRELAEAAKRDSSAMKTIAVMTMAFLPATFFAALFALPSLEDTVLQSKHWIYWALTLPATVVVFVVWILLNNRHRIISQTVNPSKRKENTD